MTGHEFEIALEALRTLLVFGCGVFLWHRLRREPRPGNAGPRLIVLGFGLLFLGSLLDVSDNFEQPGPFLVVGDTRVAAFLENLVGYLGGLVALTMGFLLWLGDPRRPAEESARREEAEAALRTSEAQLRQVQSMARIGFFLWDELADRALYYSDELAGFLGLSAEEMLASQGTQADILRHVVPEDRAAYDAVVQRAVETKGAYDVEYRVLVPGGGIRVWRELSEPVLDQAGRLVRSFGTIQDITDIRRAEDQLRIRDSWLRGILDNAPIQIAIKDTEGRIMAISRNVAETLGRTQDEFIGRTTSDFLPGHIAAVYMALDRQVLDSGLPMQKEVREEDEGTVSHYLTAKFPLRDSGGEVIGVCSLTSDITDLKLAEERLHQAQKMESLGQLTGGVAHDFNNLLAVIQANAELLELNDPDGAPLSQSILRATARGAELTQRLLAFSRRQPLRPRPVDLGALVASMSDLLKRTLGETVEIETSMAEDLWAAAADPGQVENALLNLAINARDAMPGGGKLAIECANATLDADYVSRNPEAVPGEYVVLAVTDTGTGMAPEVYERAFEPFFTTKDVGQGSGLGLSMVYGFAKQSGGQVTIYTELGKGTAVKLYLPRSAARPDEAPAGREAEEPQGRGETVLVVEDDKDLRELATRTLEALGYKPLAAEDAEAARSVLNGNGRVDLLLSDVVLPGGISGPELVQAARTHDPGLRVVLMSGYPTAAASRNGFADPGIPLLSKPFRRLDLARALRSALDG